MISKFRLSAKQFAGLTQFVAGDDNKNILLRELFPGNEPFFSDGYSREEFVTILKSAPKKEKANFQDETVMEVAVLTAEHFKKNWEAPDQKLPQQYLLRLFDAVSLFPKSRVFVRTRLWDCDAPPLTYERFWDVSTEREGSIHLPMGKVVLERRPDGKLYANGVEIMRRPVAEDLQHKKMGYLPGENKSLLVNACVADAILQDPLLMPDDWDGTTYFRGTILGRVEDPYGAMVRGISRGNKGELHISYGHFGGHNWGGRAYEAVLAR